MILIDTSALIDSLCEPRRSFEKLRGFIAAGEQPVLSAIVLYEWLRGPRKSEELLDQQQLIPAELDFTRAEASVAADLYRRVKGARGREMDLAIAATALVREASLWTLNPQDFRDIPDLHLV